MGFIGLRSYSSDVCVLSEITLPSRVSIVLMMMMPFLGPSFGRVGEGGEGEGDFS